jgi:hypothetical protein
MFTMDHDFLIEAARRQRAGLPFATVIYVQQLAISIGHCVEDLQIIAETFDAAEGNSRIVYLPL